MFKEAEDGPALNTRDSGVTTGIVSAPGGDDKQELERVRLMALASSPYQDAENEDGEGSRGDEGGPTPSAPVLEEHEGHGYEQPIKSSEDPRDAQPSLPVPILGREEQAPLQDDNRVGDAG